ncbi:MAG: HEAT repeat domain-containing protein [Candidatus Heimdallarchaeota archaeon]
MGHNNEENLLNCEEFEQIIAEIVNDFDGDTNKAKSEILNFIKEGIYNESQSIRYITTWHLSCLKENNEISTEIIKILLDVMTKDMDQCVRERAAWVLFEMSDRLSFILSDLIDIFNSSSYPEVRGYVALILGKIGNSEITPLLLSKIKKERNSKTQSLIAWGLGYLGKNATIAVPVLIDLMKNDESLVRWRSAQALGLIGDNKAIPVLLNALKEDKCGDVRSSTVNALGKLEALEAIPHINWTILNDDHEDTRFEATMAIGLMGNHANISIPVLIETMKNDESSRVWAMAVQMFPSLGKESKKAIPELINVMLNDEDEFVQIMTIRTLGSLEAKEALEPIKFLQKQDIFQNDVFEIFLALARIEGKKSDSYQQLVKLKEKDNFSEWELKDYELLSLRFDIEDRINRIIKEFFFFNEITTNQIHSEIKYILFEKIDFLKTYLEDILKQKPHSQKLILPERLMKKRLFSLRL